MDQNVNANIAHCIQSVGHIGSTTFVNICNGATTTVPWGSVEWLGAIAIGLLCLFVAALLVGFLAMMLSDVLG